MATAQKPENEGTAGTGTAVATRPKRELAPEVQARIDEARIRNQMVTAIRGTMWGKDLNHEAQRSLAEYCRQNGLDAVRHVEVLGGRIYLTADFYDERGADLIRRGIVQPEEPDYINADERLEQLATGGNDWAVQERERRLRLRIKYAVPEKASAAVIQRFVLSNGTSVIGVNWCGGGSRKSDPVGDSEPSKTAQTRARRRAWKQIAEVLPDYATVVRPIEENAKAVSEQLPIAVVERAPEPKPIAPASHEDPYEDAKPAATQAPIPPAQHSDDPAARAEDFDDELKF